MRCSSRPEPPAESQRRQPAVKKRRHTAPLHLNGSGLFHLQRNNQIKGTLTANALTPLKSDKPTRSQPALKLVKTNDLSRDQWLTVRKGGIGSSDAASAVGLNPYKSQLELWMEKTGRDAGLPKVDPQDQSSPMYWGTLLESIVAAHYTMRSGHKVRRINAVLQHPTEP